MSGNNKEPRNPFDESRAQELIMAVLNKELSLTAAAVRLGVDTNTFFSHLTDNGKNKQRVAQLMAGVTPNTAVAAAAAVANLQASGLSSEQTASILGEHANMLAAAEQQNLDMLSGSNVGVGQGVVGADGSSGAGEIDVLNTENSEHDDDDAGNMSGQEDQQEGGGELTNEGAQDLSMEHEDQGASGEENQGMATESSEYDENHLKNGGIIKEEEIDIEEEGVDDEPPPAEMAEDTERGIEEGEDDENRGELENASTVVNEAATGGCATDAASTLVQGLTETELATN